MNPITHLDPVPSPALLFDADAIRRNLELMLRIVGGDPSKLRPHIKTHKCAPILELQRGLGIRQVKAATIAEAELSARSGMSDVLISYPLVGPNVDRFFHLIDKYPETHFSALVDCVEATSSFSRKDREAVSLFVDLDCGMHRTGVAPGATAVSLVQAITADPSLRFAGLHAYDGHIHDGPLEARVAQFETAMALVEETITAIETEVCPVPLLVAGGSPTFGLHAARAASATRPRQSSPGTTVLWDYGYGDLYPDLPFERAALLLTRVVSHPGSDRPGEGRICLDLGHKSVAAENPLAHRVRFPDLPDAEFVSQSEEHLVLKVENPAAWPVGSILVGIPKHVCPTVALHQEAVVLRGGRATDERWPIGARDRRLSL